MEQQTRSAFLMAIFLAIGSNLFAQESSIDGRYHINVDKTVALLENSGKLRFDSLDQAVKQRAKESLKNREFLFHVDGTLTIQWQSQKKITTGKWEHNRQNKTLTLFIENTATVYEVQQPQAGILILTNSVTAGMFKKLYLEKKTE